MKKVQFVFKPFADYECHEFHITPVITLTWYKKIDANGIGIGFEWGFWALLIGIAKLTTNDLSTTK